MKNTTDNQNEVFDVVNEQDQVVGKATRGEVHKNKNLIHRSVGVLVFNSKGELLLQKRSETKDTDPGKWTISCSGHVNSGDTYENTAKRELREELGVQAPLIYIHVYMYRGLQETEMHTLYKTVSDGPFVFHPLEIDIGKFFTKKTLQKQVKTGEIELSCDGKMALERVGWI
jgi:isopentenyl-diphosphate delta-isomerase type 1